MIKEIKYQETAPDKRYLWLHTKNNNLVLEVFGNNGWESIGDDSVKTNDNSSEKTIQPNPVQINLPKLNDKCSKQMLIYTIETLVEALIESGLITVNYK